MAALNPAEQATEVSGRRHGCALLRDAWTRIRAELAGAGARASWVDETERRIFTSNARSLYRLPA